MKRCAIYTRKSTDEGLGQRFNSLDAQRDVCLAYIKSQSFAEWEPIEKSYDDGGFSGGCLERPALERLLQDVKRGMIDVVVVHKVDRLTRSLADFAKLAELFEQTKTSFVAVTQNLNTADSLGRLSLNILLSFAQFERELASERMRDKILAARRRGLWTGGITPLGYRLKDGQLEADDDEALAVRDIFRRYAELGSVHQLCRELRAHPPKAGRLAVRTFSRGALYAMLQNRVYRGELRAGPEFVRGCHEPIIELDLWDVVQGALIQNRVTRINRAIGPKSTPLLLGRVFADDGERMTHSFTTKRARRHDYYVCSSSARGSEKAKIRVACAKLEALVAQCVARQIGDLKWVRRHVVRNSTELKFVSEFMNLAHRALQASHEPDDTRRQMLSAVRRVDLGHGSLEISICPRSLRSLAGLVPSAVDPGVRELRILQPVSLAKGKEVALVLHGKESRADRSEAILAEVARARRWYTGLCTGLFPSMDEIARLEGISQSSVSRRISLAFLAPSLETLVAKRPPRHMTREWLFARCPLPSEWDLQAELFRSPDEASPVPSLD
jgi:site-specific DNA recombinase